MTGVRRSRRQTTDGCDQFLATETPCFDDRPALDAFRQRRSTCNRRHAPFGTKTDIGNEPGVHFEGESKYVAASRIL